MSGFNCYTSSFLHSCTHAPDARAPTHMQGHAHTHSHSLTFEKINKKNTFTTVLSILDVNATFNSLTLLHLTRLALCVLLDPPFLFNALWRAVLPLLPEVTASKISFVKPAELRSKLSAQFGPELSAWYVWRAPCFCSCCFSINVAGI